MRAFFLFALKINNSKFRRIYETYQRKNLCMRLTKENLQGKKKRNGGNLAPSSYYKFSI